MMVKINLKNNVITFFLSCLMGLFWQTSNAKEIDILNNYQNKNISEQCRNALDYYLDYPVLKGEYVRVLEFCKSTAKKLDIDGYSTNPILSDYKSMNGVNSRPRDSIHQGIDIIGSKNQPIIAITDGKVLEMANEDCWGPTLIVDHGKTFDGKNMIAIYGHVGEFLVEEGDYVQRGEIIAKLPEKVKFRCMARVRHLHLQIGQQYCKKEEKDNWGCKYFIKDFYRSLDPNLYWANGPNNVSCFDKNIEYKTGYITYPLECKKNSLLSNTFTK